MLNISVTVNQQSQSTRYPLSIITKQRYQYLRYAPTVPDHGVAISFLGLPELTEKNIFLFNECGCLANSDAYLGYTIGPVEVAHSNLEYKFETRILDFYLTDKVALTPKGEKKPHWFCHPLLNDDGTPVESYINMRILDKDMNDVDTSDWQVVQETDQSDSTKKVWKVYHDLEPWIEANTDKYAAYYITFQSNIGEKIFQLLESKRVFVRLESVNQFLSRTQRTYEANPTSAGIFEIATKFAGGINTDLYFRPALTGQIKAFKPFEVNNATSWQLKFTNGGFITTVGNKVYRYSIPEFKRQGFYQNRIRERIREIPSIEGANEGTLISKRLIKSKYYPLYLESSQGCYLEIVVMDKDGIAFDGYTNNPYKTFWQDPDKQETVELRLFTRFNDFSINTETGIIRLPYELKEDDRILINGCYLENYFEYDLEFNPVFNREILDKKVIFYLKPQVVIDRLLILEDPWTDRGLFHLIVDETDQIVDWSKEEDDTPSDPDLSNNTTWELNQFFQKYPEKLIITKVYIGRLASPSDVEVIDTRIRGGGIKEEYDLGLLSGKFPEITWVADFGRWDGKPYPGQGTLLVEIPESLTKAGGGELEDSDIRTVVEKHMAAGIYPIIQYYGSRPTIQKAWGEKFGDNAKLNLEWDSVETAQSYNVYNIKNDGSRTLIGDTENTFLYDALTPTVTGDIYVVQIFPVHDDEEGLGSDRISIKAG